MKYISVDEAAKKLGKSYGFVRKRIDSGEIKNVIKIGSTYRIPLNSIEEFKNSIQDEVKGGYSISDIAEKLNISYGLANSLVKKGEIKAYKSGRKYIISEEEFQRFVNENTNDEEDDSCKKNNDESFVDECENDDIERVMKKIKELNELMQQGAINEEEFHAMKKKLLSKI